MINNIKLERKQSSPKSYVDIIVKTLSPESIRNQKETKL